MLVMHNNVVSGPIDYGIKFGNFISVENFENSNENFLNNVFEINTPKK